MLGQMRVGLDLHRGQLRKHPCLLPGTKMHSALLPELYHFENWASFCSSPQPVEGLRWKLTEWVFGNSGDRLPSFAMGTLKGYLDAFRGIWQLVAWNGRPIDLVSTQSPVYCRGSRILGTLRTVDAQSGLQQHQPYPGKGASVA